jgi:ADP-ribose pyrophosphatase YjhB (NUDIX family)
VNPDGPWGEVAALDGDRLLALAGRWILPACQLLFFESPEEAARRIATEQLRRADVKIPAPQVFSESYARGSGRTGDPHWDLHFIFKTDWPGGDLSDSLGTLWSELAFVPVKTTPLSAFGRGHGDILSLAGIPPRASESDEESSR